MCIFHNWRKNIWPTDQTSTSEGLTCWVG